MKTSAIGSIVDMPFKSLSRRGFGKTSGNAEKAAARIATINPIVVAVLIFGFVLNLDKIS